MRDCGSLYQGITAERTDALESYQVWREAQTEVLGLQRKPGLP